MTNFEFPRQSLASISFPHFLDNALRQLGLGSTCFCCTMCSDDGDEEKCPVHCHWCGVSYSWIKYVCLHVADDLRPQLSCMGIPGTGPKMHTPHICGLANRSALFAKNYVQQAVCSPSRTSLLTSRRIGTTKVVDLYSYFRNVAGRNSSNSKGITLWGWVKYCKSCWCCIRIWVFVCRLLNASHCSFPVP